MGCNKSKSQHESAERHITGQSTPCELGIEDHPIYGDNVEFNQNRISNVGFHSDRALNYELAVDRFQANSEHQSGCGCSNVPVTGSFGVTAQLYNPNNRFNSTQSFSTNEFSPIANNHISFNGLSEYTNSLCNNSSQGQSPNLNIQRHYDNQPYCLSGFNQDKMYGTLDHEPVLGPPSRSVSKTAKNNSNMSCFLRPLARCRSFSNDNRRGHQNTLQNTVARHSSLENISTISGFRTRYTQNNFGSDNNLFWNSYVHNEEFSRDFIPRWHNSERQSRRRGLKRNSLDIDSLNSSSTSSDNLRFLTENNIPGDGPRVKRRHSDTNGSKGNTTGMYTDDRNIKKEEIVHEQIMNQSVEQVNVFDEPFDILDLLMFPEEWSSCAVARTGLVDISLSSPEGVCVQKYFGRSSQSKDFKLCITAIARIENPFIHSYYLLKKQEMKSRNEHVDELYLYHGTKRKHLSGILEENLNWRLYSENHRFGQGVSFSPLATYSSHYCDKSPEKVMLLFKVLASNSIVGSTEMKVPPIIDNVVYDVSTKDDTTVIVKYSDNEFYPLYKITYVKIMRNLF